MEKTPTIAIIGAGPSGLTLARLLRVADVKVAITIFEHDTSAKSRKYQGGTLDLHPDTGLAAVRKAGLWDEAFKYLRYDAEELVIADKNATELMHMKEQPKTADNKFARPEIDREVLKDMLLASVDPSIIRWGKVLQSVNEQSGILTFRDGTTAGPFDLVVGADGAWSKVRPVLTSVRPSYSGVCGFQCRITKPDEEYPHISKMVGRGSYFSSSDRKSLMAQRLGDETLKVALWLIKDENYAKDILTAYGSDEKQLKAKILENLAGWEPKMKEWIEVGTDFQSWNLYELPVGHKWDHKKGYTLVGDAASLMTPFAGEGVNKAMRDCLELAEAIEASLKEGTDIDVGIQNYEVKMFPRAEYFQEKTMGNKVALFSESGPANWLARQVTFVIKEELVDVDKGLGRLVPVRLTCYVIFRIIQIFGSWKRGIRERFAR
ncbi:hypothetical protein PV10_04379 [Exophiala mesophila]|uniref:FAD-binding domain-containing protein n=1 Tax=Exophiala mesophila TaxID=212818 RepID=A0A0D1XY35_EXOME|nr:uncharacterized protein PV10_04379 [Exophiala mesophila]KIV93141.1 hypothetical protein PV10_04379 [Exophiala mesophila]